MAFLINLDIARDVHLVVEVRPAEVLAVRPFGEPVPTLTFGADRSNAPIQVPGFVQASSSSCGVSVDVLREVRQLLAPRAPARERLRVVRSLPPLRSSRY